MASIRNDQPLVSSVLDRLIDDSPEETVEAIRNRSQLLREMKVAVRRDLENLLNTRRRNLIPPKDLTEVKASLITYGLPDFSGTAPSGVKERDAFCRQIETVILANEPRFLTVKVGLVSNTETMDRTLRFKIDALMRADPAPEPVIFDSAMEPVTGEFEVRGG